ncbi:hypothetical protein [Streptomyces sp. HPF1205]|uniref:hypothetical protein n=1 Tax=Streptomyces sp. HPF1205 TaxID=2873262 RepID=UPI001CED76A1|nr:hypothetical protein [Streptomyces sp. HPF1205]
MARIRTIKPEAWDSEDLASVPVTAVLTFFGLLTLADDAGRFRAHPAIIHGRLWALRPEHTPVHVAADLEQLARAGLICLYTGCDGRTYLHIVTWAKHQKIDRATPSRLPACPEHGSPTRHGCGGCGQDACTNPHRATSVPAGFSPVSTAGPVAGDTAGRGPAQTRRALDRPVSADPAPAADLLPEPEEGCVTAASPVPEDGGECAGQTVFVEASMHPREPSSSGSRILDPGSVPVGRQAPAPDTSPVEVSAKDLLGEYISACNRRPPSNTLGHLGKQIRILLGEGFEPEPIRAALDKLRTKGLHPSVLPSLVNEIVNAAPQVVGASGGGPWARTASPAYVPYQNPDGPAPSSFGIGGRR